MLKLDPLKSEKIWGYELWIASVHPAGPQENFVRFTGGNYPLLVKIIQANDTLSVQVHPDDELAARLEGSRGKTECWYVLSAEPGARLIYGMNGKPSADELKEAIEHNTLEKYMRSVSVKAGDFAYIPAGTVHAIGGGLRLLEVQQSSDITYRLYDWGRGRECHVEKGIASIKHFENQSVCPFASPFECEYFSLTKIDVCGKSEGSFAKDFAGLIFVLSGQGQICGAAAKAEDIFAFAPGEHFTLEGTFSLMQIVPKRA